MKILRTLPCATGLAIGAHILAPIDGASAMTLSNASGVGAAIAASPVPAVTGTITDGMVTSTIMDGMADITDGAITIITMEAGGGRRRGVLPHLSSLAAGAISALDRKAWPHFGRAG